MATNLGNAPDVDFYDPTRNARVKHRSKPMWRGDHSQCKRHLSGICVARRGWIFNGRSWKLQQHIVPVSVEPVARTMVDYGPTSTKEPTTVQKHKGMLDVEDADSGERLYDNVRPSPALFRHHLERNLKEIETDLRRKGEKWPEIKKAQEERKAAILDANGVAEDGQASRAPATTKK